MGVMGSKVVLRVVEGGCGCCGYKVVLGGSRGGLWGVVGSMVVLGVVEGGMWVLWDPRWY